MKIPSQICLLSLKLSYLLTLGIFLLDVIFYAGFVHNHFLFTPLQFLLVTLIFHGLLIYFTKKRLNTDFVIANLYFLAPLMLFFGGLAYYLEEYGLLFPNYFFANFKVYYMSLLLVAAPAAAFGLLHASRNFWRLHWRQLFFLLMFILILAAGSWHTIDRVDYKQFMAEDGLVEYLTAILFGVSGILAVLLTKNRSYFTHKWPRKLFVTGCTLAAVAFFVVAGEEISWGQRLLGLETPAAMAEQNRQGEINLHNSEALWPFVYSAYALIGIYGLVMWIIDWLTKDVFFQEKKYQVWKKIIVPGGYLFFNFGLISLYVWLRRNHGPWKYSAWEEISELFLVLGITVHLIELYLTFPRKSGKLIA